MSKEVYIALIQKDIRELDMIAQGLYETELPSPTIIKLASSKAQDVVNNLQKLAQIKFEKKEPAINAINTPQHTREKEADSESTEHVIIEQHEPQPEEKSIEEPPKEALPIVPEITTPPQAEIIIEKTTEETEKKIWKEEKKAIIERTEKIETMAEKVIGSKESRIEMMSKGKDNSLADSLANKKISDLRRAIPMGERFRFQRELFANNANTLNQTLDALNACNNADEASQYLSDHFDWDTENQNVIDFLNILSRRF